MAKLSEWLQDHVGRDRAQAGRSRARRCRTEAAPAHQDSTLPASGVSSAVAASGGVRVRAAAVPGAAGTHSLPRNPVRRSPRQPPGVVAFVGRCLKGPVNEPVAITEFQRSSSSISAACGRSRLLPHAVEQFFEHGGQRAIIVRVVSEGTPPTLDLPAGDERAGARRRCVPARTSTCASRSITTASASRTRICSTSSCSGCVRRGSELVEQPGDLPPRCRCSAARRARSARMLAASRLVRVSGPLPLAAAGYHARQRSARAGRLCRMQQRWR